MSSTIGSTAVGSNRGSAGGGGTGATGAASSRRPQSQNQQHHLITITTSNPSSSITTSGGGGSLIVIDGKSLSILTSLRTTDSSSNNSNNPSMGNNNSDSTSTGFSSLSPFPSHFVNTVVAAGRRSGGGGTSTSYGGSSVAAASNVVPAITFGGNANKRGDTYASLVSIRCGGSSSSSPPIIHWKTRLPEPDFYKAGLKVSPCGHYVVGGASSGSCYVWSTTTGRLMKTFQAHYRAVTALCWTGGNHKGSSQFLVTGGADGMIHVFSMMDLVATTNEGEGNFNSRNNVGGDGSNRTAPSLCTFSIHHFPVTSLISLDGGRIASASEDGQVIVVEVFSEQVLVNVQLPHGGGGCLTFHPDGRLFAGSNRGTIYSVDMNAYAIRQTQKQGAMISKRRRQEWQRIGVNANNSTFDEITFGVSKASNEYGGNAGAAGATIDDTLASYQTDWIGHSHQVTSIELLIQDQPQLLISGDSSGCVRIWDIEARTCLKVLHPWSHSVSTTNNNNASDGSNPSLRKKNALKGHPVTSIQIIPQPDDVSLARSESGIIFGSSSISTGGSKNSGSIPNLLPPLQKYASIDGMDESHNHSLISSTALRIPFMKPNESIENASYWEARPIRRKCRAYQTNNEHQQQKQVGGDRRGNCGDNSNQEEIDAMRQELETLRAELKEKQSTIERWENVNNKLIQKLKANN